MSTVITAQGCIPLMSHGPSPTAVNSAQNYRQGLIGALVSAAPTNPSAGPPAWLSGVLCTTSYNSPPGFAGGYPIDLLPIALNTAGQGVAVYAGVAVVSRGPVIGPYLVCFNTTSTINLDAADTTNPRIDVVYVAVNDDAIGDGGATNGATMAVVNGTPASSPTAPAVPAGALPLAQIYRNTVANSGNAISQSNITDVRTSAGTAGGIRTYLPGDSLTAAGSHNGEFTFDIANYGLRYWMNTAWKGVQTKVIPTTSFPLGTGAAMNTGGAIYVLAQTSVADPGYAYTLRIDAKCDFRNYSNASTQSVRIRLDNSSTGTVIALGGTEPTTGWSTVGLQGCLSGTLTGAHTVYFTYEPSVSGAPTTQFPGNDGSVWCNVEIIPV